MERERRGGRERETDRQREREAEIEREVLGLAKAASVFLPIWIVSESES